MNLKSLNDRQLQSMLIDSRARLSLATGSPARAKWAQRIEAIRIEMAARAYRKMPAKFKTLMA